VGYLLQQIINGLILGLVYGLFAVGLGLVLANLGIFNLAHVGVFAWAAIAAYVSMEVWHWPVVLGYVFGISTGIVANIVVYYTSIRFLQFRANAEMAGFISTVGALLAMTQLGSIVLGEGNTVHLPFNAFPVHVWRGGELQISAIQVAMAVVAVASFALLGYTITRTQLGRSITAASYDSELAGLLGVNVRRVTIAVFAIAGALAAVAALLFSVAFGSISSDMGNSYSVIAIAITVIGGYGNIKGTLLAALLFGLLSTLIGGYITTAYEQLLIYAVFVAILIVRPKGLLGRVERIV
jgi:branched-chain amino acid transport system permease protein